MIEPGEVLQSRYSIEVLIGQGGMGRVYRARQTLLGRRKVAVKEIDLDTMALEDRAEAVLAFLREAETLGDLSHPNLVSVNDCFEERGQLFLVMEYVDGRTLEELLLEHPGGVPVETVLEWARQLCTALTYLHTESPAVIFRDLKPANIMLDRHQTIRLIDFGIAQRIIDQVRGEPVQQGTPGYAPIEQLLDLGMIPDARSDIYALGATLYQLLTGQCPPDARVRLVDDELIPPARLNPKVPSWLSVGLVKMLSLRCQDRFDKVLHVRDWLDHQATAQLLHAQAKVQETDYTPEPPQGLSAWWQSGSLSVDIALQSLVNQTLTFCTQGVRPGRLPRELFFNLPPFKDTMAVGIRIKQLKADVNTSVLAAGHGLRCEAQLINPPLHLLRGIRDALAAPLHRVNTQQRRHGARTPVELDVLVHDPALMARTVDLSHGGARIRTAVPLTLGQVLPLTVLLEDVVLPDVEAKGEVRSCQARWGGGYESGVRWTALDPRTLDVLGIYLDRVGSNKTVSA